VGRPVPALRVAKCMQIQTSPARLAALGLALAAPSSLFPAPGVLAQTEPPWVSGSTGISLTWLRSNACCPRVMPASSRGDLAAPARTTTLARDVSLRLLGLYRDLSGAFRGLDARIPREDGPEKVAKLEPWPKFQPAPWRTLLAAPERAGSGCPPAVRVSG